jgi:hypothetical protein
MTVVCFCYCCKSGMKRVERLGDVQSCEALRIRVAIQAETRLSHRLETDQPANYSPYSTQHSSKSERYRNALCRCCCADATHVGRVELPTAMQRRARISQRFLPRPLKRRCPLSYSINPSPSFFTLTSSRFQYCPTACSHCPVSCLPFSIDRSSRQPLSGRDPLLTTQKHDPSTT